jgi:hypothetical protein
MVYAIIRYRVRPECRDDNEAKVRAVFEELRRAAPADTRYLVFATDTGEFVHVAASASGDSASLTRLPAFQAFLEGHAQRRAGEVARTDCTLIGEYTPPAAAGG